MGQTNPQSKDKKVNQPKAKEPEAERLIKCEVVRTIFVEGSKAGSYPIHPGKLSYADEMENAKRKKAGQKLIEPEVVTFDFPEWIVKKHQRTGVLIRLD